MRKPLLLVAAVLAVAASPSVPAQRPNDETGQLAAQADRRIARMTRDIVKRATKDATSKDPERRRAAAESLAGVRSAEAVALLLQALADPDDRVRAQAASSLADAEQAAEPARSALQHALEDRFPSVVAQAAEALERALGASERELGPARQRVLDEARDEHLRFLAARSLTGQVPGPLLLEAILDYMDLQLAGRPSDDYKLRSAREHNLEIGQDALEHLCKSKDRSLLAPLAEAVRSFPRRADLPLKALALFEPRPEGWAELLVELLQSREPEVLREVLFLMGRTAKSSADVALWAPAAARLAGHRDPAVRQALVYALGEAGGLASEQIDVPLRALAEEPEPGARRTAAQALGQIGDREQATPAAGKRLVAERARQPLARAAADDADPEVREQAQRALERLLAPGAAPARPAAASAAGGAGGAGERGSEARALELLRSRGEKLDTRSFYGALGNLDVELVAAYLDAGMSIGERLEGGEFPLRFLLRGGACAPQQRPTALPAKALVRLLLARGADPNMIDLQGNTALMEAASQGCDRELIGLLIEAGAKVGAKNASGLTAFELGLYSGHDGLEELIAAGYRLPADKARQYARAYASNPRSVELLKRATSAR